MKQRLNPYRSVLWTVCCLAILLLLPDVHRYAPAAENLFPCPIDLATVERYVDNWPQDTGFPDDRYAVAVLKEAIAAANEHNGPIGACLVRQSDGQIVERGRNRQFEPYFRSHAHAEMDLLDRYEARMQVPGPHSSKGGNPRKCYEGLALYSTLEPCPMCLTRILNAGISKIYYLAPDESGGMASRIGALPPFWRNLTRERVIAQAQCSPQLRELALQLFACRGHLRRTCYPRAFKDHAEKKENRRCKNKTDAR
jgi:tRNA(adenine34) deaminase